MFGSMGLGCSANSIPSGVGEQLIDGTFDSEPTNNWLTNGVSILTHENLNSCRIARNGGGIDNCCYQEFPTNRGDTITITAQAKSIWNNNNYLSINADGTRHDFKSQALDSYITPLIFQASSALTRVSFNAATSGDTYVEIVVDNVSAIIS